MAWHCLAFSSRTIVALGAYPLDTRKALFALICNANCDAVLTFSSLTSRQKPSQLSVPPREANTKHRVYGIHNSRCQSPTISLSIPLMSLGIGRILVHFFASWGLSPFKHFEVTSTHFQAPLIWRRTTICPFYHSTNSTRRFFERPSSVPFDATGE